MGFPYGLFPFPPIPILSMLKLYIISDTLIIMFLITEILIIYYHYAQTRTRGRINYISVVGKFGTIRHWHLASIISSSQHKTFGNKFP